MCRTVTPRPKIVILNFPHNPTAHTVDIGFFEEMVKLAKQGNRVLRLKGGDPFIFGRGGEEIEALFDHGIGFQVVPGITAASGCSTYAGIPLTHRDHAQACTFVTAHGKDGYLDLDWDNMIRGGQTVAIYMGLSSLEILVDGLRRRGADMATPVAVVQNGTRADQRIETGTLDDISDRVRAAKMKTPAMIIIGSVVNLRAKLNWTNAANSDHYLSLSPATTDGFDNTSD